METDKRKRRTSRREQEVLESCAQARTYLKCVILAELNCREEEPACMGLNTVAQRILKIFRERNPFSSEVGACLVSQTGIILGIGYNGFPRGCSDDKLPWAKMSANGDHLETKYPYVVHAEVNAILNTNHASAAGQRLYVTMFPCNECAKVIIQSGVSEVIYFTEKRLNNSDAMYTASHKLLSLAGVKVRKHHPQMTEITLKLEKV